MTKFGLERRMRVARQMGKLFAIFSLTAACTLANSVVFTSSSAFNAALGGAPTIVEDYGSFTAGDLITPVASIHGITYTNFTLTSGTQGLISNQFNSFSGLSLGANNGGAQFFFDGNTFDISFAPTFAIGIFFNVNQNSGTFGITTSAGTATSGSAAYDTSTFVFAGLISDVPFTSAQIFSGSGGAGTASYNIPEIILAAQTTPEPSSLAATALGVGLLAALMLRRKSTTRLAHVDCNGRTAWTIALRNPR